MTCRWQARDLDTKRVAYSFAKGKKTGIGHFSVSILEEGKLQITIVDANDSSKMLKLTQIDADSIDTHYGEYRFKCVLH